MIKKTDKKKEKSTYTQKMKQKKKKYQNCWLALTEKNSKIYFGIYTTYAVHIRTLSDIQRYSSKTVIKCQWMKSPKYIYSGILDYFLANKILKNTYLCC